MDNQCSICSSTLSLYRCTQCPSFIICKACYSAGSHQFHEIQSLENQELLQPIIPILQSPMECFQPPLPIPLGNPKIHIGIICDSCKITPIVGSRFKCTKCANYDLCNTCHSKNVHPEHNFDLLI